MNLRRRFLALSTCLAAVLVAPATAGAQSRPAGGTPPAFVDVPDTRPGGGVTNTPAHLATGVSDTLRQKIVNAHAGWKRDEDAALFNSGVTFAEGAPILMLVTAKQEPAALSVRRQRAMLAGCEFLVDADASERAWICVVEYDEKKPSEQTVRNHEVRRGAFESATKAAGKSANVKDALKEARKDDATVRQLCTVLGLR